MCESLGDPQEIRVGVLIPAYNDQKGLDETLQALADEPIPCHVYVVDDGSVPAMIAPPATGPHVVSLVALDRNRGIEHALNAGIERIRQAGHAYISRLDCGDLALPGRLGRQVALLDAEPDLGIVGTWARCVDDDGAYLFTLRFPHEHAAMARKQRYVPALLHPTVMIRTGTLNKAGVYSDRFRTAEDYDLFIRIAQVSRMANIPEALTSYIISPSGTTTSKRRRNLVSRLGVQREYFDARDPHAYLGVARTLLFMILPFSWINAAKQRIWR